MSRLLWICAFGLCCLLSCSQASPVISCRFKGIFHVEKDGRYKVAEEESVEICAALNSTLATMEQMRTAHESGFETCRYGWIDGHVVIPRITKNPICAANHTGIYILTSNKTLHYDVYCFNASETRDKVCDPVIVSDVLSSQKISIDSYDPSLQETQNPYGNQNSDPDVPRSSDEVPPTEPGQAIDNSHLGGPGDSDQGTSQPETFSDQNIPTDQDLYESTEQTDDNAIGHSGDGSHRDQSPTKEYADQEDHLIHADHGNHAGFGDHGRTEDTTTTKAVTSEYEPFGEGNNYNYGENDQDRTTQEEGTNENPDDGVLSPTDSDTEYEHEDHTDDGKPNKGRKKSDDRSYLDSGPAYGDNGSANGSAGDTTAKPKRGATVPDWLIVTVSLVSLGLILSVCIALNSTRLCGQKKKLVINGKKASLEDGGIMEHNGDTAKSQEMVQLVSRDPADPAEQNNINQEDVRNRRDVDMKIGV